ncbi:MAG: hypothetical protein IJS15_07355 [Victivallales bacterium]|nr:hypothetical protein [Victivallales bacterium]
MEQREFENLLDEICAELTLEARHNAFTSSSDFENRVRALMAGHSRNGALFEIDMTPHPQAFPDIAVGEYGIEVKFTTDDIWRTIGNSIQENQRIETVKYIYVVFGKMGGLPEVRWGEYEASVVHVRTSHVPRFEVEIAMDESSARESLFEQMGIRYDDFRKLDMAEKMKYIRRYARKLHPDGKLWWLEGLEEHTLPIQARLYTKLEQDEKDRLRAEAALLCPEIVKSGRSRDKYDSLVLFLLTYHGVLCHQARDLFSAGSVANPKNDDQGGIYIARALHLIEHEIEAAAQRLPDSLFVEYWGESVPVEQRVAKWLERADALAKDWTPSKTLFRGSQEDKNNS